MTLQQLEYFVELAKKLHYTKAAEALNISQPSLSYAIQELSKELGVPLFKRIGKRNQLTAYGEVFLPYVERALHLIQQGENELEKMTQSITGTINLGFIYSVSFDLVPKLIDDFYYFLGNRDIGFDLQVGKTSSLIKKLLDGQLDLVIAPAPYESHEKIKSISVFQQELFLIVDKDHPLSKKEAVTFEDLKDEQMIMIHKDTDLFFLTETLFKVNNIKPQTAFVVDECNSMASFVGSKFGVAIMPKIPSLNSFNVVAIPFGGERVSREISLLYNGAIHQSSALKTFLNFYQNSTV